jgi:hypothetical protein
MSGIGITANVELADLVDMIIDDVRDHETIRNFILALDRAVADYNFTVDLRNRLNEAIYETWWQDIKKPIRRSITGEIKMLKTESLRWETTRQKDTAKWMIDTMPEGGCIIGQVYSDGVRMRQITEEQALRIAEILGGSPNNLRDSAF